MKPIATLIFTLLPMATALRAVEAPEFDRLRANYQAAIERATKTLTQSYLIELEKQRGSYERASKPDAGNVVQAEINATKQAAASAELARKLQAKSPPSQDPSVASQTHWFAGKTWLTDQKTKWSFNRKGTGEKVRGHDTIAMFTWKLLDSGNLELTELAGAGKPATTTYVHFKNKSEAWFGSSEDKLDNRLHTE